jgi:hypothetical protein
LVIDIVTSGLRAGVAAWLTQGEGANNGARESGLAGRKSSRAVIKCINGGASIVGAAGLIV